MRRFLVILTIVAIAVTGCSDDGAESGEASPTTSASAVASDTDPIAVCDRVLRAEADGDVEAWAAAIARNATILMPMDSRPRSVWAASPWGGDDFDDDGTASIADGLMADTALGPAASATIEWDCGVVSDGRVECSVTKVDEFLRRSGLEPAPFSVLYTIEGEQVVQWEIPPAQTAADHDAAMEQLFAQHALYQSWVQDTYSDEFASLFHDPCCDARRINTADSVARHDDLMAEYFATTG